MRESNPSDTLGTVEWEILEAPSRRIAYRGRRDLKPGDIQVLGPPEQIRSGPWPSPYSPTRAVFALLDFYRKQLPLEQGFYLELVSKPTAQREEVIGFGIAARRKATPTFSWEWFNVESDERATKLQEGGALGIRISQGAKGWEIASTEFLTDISFRIQLSPPGCLYGIASLLSPAPYWRVRILKGSSVTWPLITNDVPAAPPN